MEATLWNDILDIFKFTIPGVLCLGIAYLIFNQMIRRQEVQERAKIRENAFNTYLPLKLSAYERAILYLERIQPTVMIPRCDPHQKTAQLFILQLLMEIEAEYEHNIVQQLYISETSWNVLIGAKKEVIGLIRLAGQSVRPNASAYDFADALAREIKAREEEGELLTSLAIRSLKSDIVRLFGV
jgi:hypothetical protein